MTWHCNTPYNVCTSIEARKFRLSIHGNNEQAHLGAKESKEFFVKFYFLETFTAHIPVFLGEHNLLQN